MTSERKKFVMGNLQQEQKVLSLLLVVLLLDSKEDTCFKFLATTKYSMLRGQCTILADCPFSVMDLLT